MLFCFQHQVYIQQCLNNLTVYFRTDHNLDLEISPWYISTSGVLQLIPNIHLNHRRATVFKTYTWLLRWNDCICVNLT